MAHSCAASAFAKWDTIAGDLVSVHDSLVQKKEVDIGKSNSAAAAWVDPISIHALYYVQFVSAATTAVVDVDVSVAKSKANAEIEKAGIFILISKIAYAAKLSTAAHTCIEESICIGSENKGGTYLDEIYYGLSLQGSVSTEKAKAELSGGIPSIKMSAKLSSGDLNLKFVVAGEIKTVQDLKNKGYDIPQIVEDLNNKKILSVLQKVDSLTSRYDVVGIHVAKVSPEVCARINPKGH
jgi:hypothetical protein